MNHRLYVFMMAICLLMTPTSVLAFEVGLAGVPKRFLPYWKEFVEVQERACAAFENGRLSFNPGGVQYVADFNGDGIVDPIVNESSFSCSASATLFSGGAGGGEIQVFVSSADPSAPYQRYAFMGLGYEIIFSNGRAILVLAQDGSTCGLTGSEICFAAHSWIVGTFVASGGSVGPASDNDQ